MCSTQKKPDLPKKSATGELKPPPEFLAERLAMWDRLKKEREEFVASQVGLFQYFCAVTSFCVLTICHPTTYY